MKKIMKVVDYIDLTPINSRPVLYLQINFIVSVKENNSKIAEYKFKQIYTNLYNTILL